MRKTNIIGMFLLCLCTNWVTLQAQQSLKFNNKGLFKIVQFTDTHYVPSDSRSKNTIECMEKVLDTEKPDLVIYTGDLIFGKPASVALDSVLHPVISRHLPFAVTWGNHDDEQDMTREQLSNYIKNKPGNLTSTVEGITGETNYHLTVHSSIEEKEASILYIFDSNAYSTLPQIKGYGWIQPDQVSWYIKKSSEFTHKNNGNPLPALAFFHIPLPEYNEAAKDEQTLLWGIRKERACVPLINTGLYAAMLQSGDVMGVFVGHDHVNDYVVNWKGILLGYGRFTGGETVYYDIPGGNGARVIELKEGARTFTTWIRNKNGEKLNLVNYPMDFK